MLSNKRPKESLAIIWNLCNQCGFGAEEYKTIWSHMNPFRSIRSICRDGQLTHLFFPGRVGRGYGPGWTLVVVSPPQKVTFLKNDFPSPEMVPRGPGPQKYLPHLPTFFPKKSRGRFPQHNPSYSKAKNGFCGIFRPGPI